MLSFVETGWPFNKPLFYWRGSLVPAESFISDVGHSGVKERLVIPVWTSRRYFNGCLTRGGSSLLPCLSQGNHCATWEMGKAEVSRSFSVVKLYKNHNVSAWSRAPCLPVSQFSSLPNTCWLCWWAVSNPKTRIIIFSSVSRLQWC